jgi:hypothetical protein
VTETVIKAVRAAAAAAFAQPPERIEPLPGGANNLVLRVVLGARTVLAKVYFRHPGDRRDRLGAEFGMLAFLWKNGLRCVPEPVFADPARQIGFYQYIAGRRLRPGEIAWPEVAQLLELLAAMWKLRAHPGAAGLPPGSDSAFSIGGFVRNVRARFEFVTRTLGRRSAPRAAREFVRTDVEATWRALAAFIRQEARRDGLGFRNLIPGKQRTLNPADHGFHNALCGPDGRLTFLDFEYAGWDDPVQMICNACLQPAVPIPAALQRRFVEALLDRMGHPATLAARLRLLYPLFGFKWCLIMLNEFLPVSRERRRFAGARPEDLDRRQAQLAKAQRQAQAVRDYLAAPVFFDGLG